MHIAATIPTRITSDSAAEPLSATEAREWIKAADDLSDDEVTFCIEAARRRAELDTEHAFITKTCLAKLDGFWGGHALQLAHPPLLGITSIKYYDTDNALQTLSSAVYTVDTHSRPGRVFLAPDQEWPDTYDKPHAVEVTYTAGFGAEATAVPSEFVNLVRLLLSHVELQREPVLVAQPPAALPYGLEYLVRQVRIDGANETRIAAL